MPTSRRAFVKWMAAGATLAPLAAYCGRPAADSREIASGYGRLAPALPLNSDALVGHRADGGVAFDYTGQPVLALPAGFRYWAVSWTGQTMSDGSRVPGDHDGLAAFAGPARTTILVRNHELANREAKFGDTAGVVVPNALKHDPWCNGGTTTLVLDRNGRLLRDFASLGGTDNNCAGGPTPWGTWLSCEESVASPDTRPGYTKRHGYVFEVPAHASGPVKAEPLAAMGRFQHEAAAVDPASGIVYLTEDRGDGCFYRFVPHVAGRLARGGRLQALRLRDLPDAVTRTGFAGARNQALACAWVDIEDVDPVRDCVRHQGHAKGAARFSRGEGAWYAGGRVNFVCSDGGEIGRGQVWSYDPAADSVALIVESTDPDAFDMPDNITAGPDGRLYVYEDGDGGNAIVGIERNGASFRFAENLTGNGSELCGGCFSPDGRFMFVNVQRPGLTLVIEGPWRRAP